MKKILIIGPRFPYPLLSGGHQAFFNSIDVLRQDFEIFLLFNGNEPSKESLGALKNRWMEVTFCPYFPDKRKYSNVSDFLMRLEKKIFNVFFNSYKLDCEFSTSVRNYSDDYLDYINGIVANNGIDIVQTEFVPNLSLVAALPKSVKTVFVHHELRFVRQELFMKEQNLMSSPHYGYKHNCSKNEELAFLSLYDAIITLSEIDAKKLIDEGIPTQKIHSSFAIIKNKKSEKEFNDFKGCLTFVGPETHAPNKIGLEWFLDDCWSMILKEDDKLQLKIIGEWSSRTQKLWRSKYKNIEFSGFVENLHEALAGSVMIVPITIGSGIRMKILEAANMGIPFVTTDIGVEGLPFVDGKDCFIGSRADEFATKLLQLKNDLALQQVFTLSANNKINQIFSHEKLRESRISIYNNVLNLDKK